ncbi:Uncharacterized protein dnm_005100 [Desulfonema magnum]|uniref:Uncharacterized protein n=1 Tax=Desulfonema magnum TaxID=45655 RepID=A0A975BFT9_9BACT|nr:Uncharacterized protein dnm_005100 [Desulfonema magnum]
MLGVRKKCKTFILRCDRQVMPIYMKIRSAKIKRSGFLQRLSWFVVTGRPCLFI